MQLPRIPSIEGSCQASAGEREGEKQLFGPFDVTAFTPPVSTARESTWHRPKTRLRVVNTCDGKTVVTPSLTTIFVELEEDRVHPRGETRILNSLKKRGGCIRINEIEHDEKYTLLDLE